jgi:hypothetical protein
MPEKEDFKFILIEFDGKIKVVKSQPLLRKELIAIIDVIPMRSFKIKK